MIRRLALIAAATAGIGCLFSGWGIDRGYPTALYGLTCALVEDHSLSLDGQKGLLGYDWAVYRDRLYSDKAPGPALLMVPVYLVVRQLTADPDWRFTLTLLIGLTIPAATAPIAVGLLTLRLGGTQPVEAAATFAGGSLYLPYLTVGVADPVATAAVAWAWALGMRRDGGRLALAGGLAGFAVLCRYQTLLLVLPLAVGVAVVRRRRAWPFLVMFAVMIGAVLGYNALCFDDPLTFPTWHWRGKAGAAPTLQASAPDAGRLAAMTLGWRRGLLVFTPLLLAAPLGLWHLSRRHAGTAASATAALLAYFGFLSANRGWVGGADYGMRFSLVALPLLWGLIYAGEGLPMTRLRRALAAPGIVVALLGLLGGPYVPFTEPHPIAWKARQIAADGPTTILSGTSRGPQ